MDRRAFLKITGAGIVAAGGSFAYLAGCQNTPEMTLAERVAKNFPDLPEARGTQRVPIPGSRKCLIYIRDTHAVQGNVFGSWLESRVADEQNRNDWKEIYRQINACGKDAAAMLAYCAKTYPESQFFTEGTTGVVDRKRALSEYTMCMKRLKQTGLCDFDPDAMRDEYIMLKKKQRTAVEEMRLVEVSEKLDTIKYIPGGDLFLAKDGIISMIGAEKPETQKAAVAVVVAQHNGTLVEPELSKKMEQVVMKDREWAALDIMAREKSPIPVLTYGGEHTFVASVDAWNKKYPEMMYSIVAITPKNYWTPTILK